MHFQYCLVYITRYIGFRPQTTKHVAKSLSYELLGELQMFSSPYSSCLLQLKLRKKPGLNFNDAILGRGDDTHTTQHGQTYTLDTQKVFIPRRTKDQCPESCYHQQDAALG